MEFIFSAILLLLGLALGAGLIYLAIQVWKNFQPGRGRVLADVRKMKAEIEPWTAELVPWDREEL